MKHIYESHRIGNGQSQIWKRTFHFGERTTDELIATTTRPEEFIEALYAIETAIEKLPENQFLNLALFASALNRLYQNNK